MAKVHRPQRATFSPLLGFLSSLFCVASLLYMSQVRAATEPAKTPNAPAKRTTDVSFEDVLVQGKYHFSDEAVTTVEEDKVLDSLLGVRKDFQDRIKKSVSRQ